MKTEAIHSPASEKKKKHQVRAQGTKAALSKKQQTLPRSSRIQSTKGTGRAMSLVVLGPLVFREAHHLKKVILFHFYQGEGRSASLCCGLTYASLMVHNC